MAIACLRFFTLCLPLRMWCISVRTSCPAFLPYLRPELFLREEPELLREDLPRDELFDEDFLELDFLAICFSLGPP